MILSFRAANLRDRSQELDRSWRTAVARRVARRRLKRAAREAGIVLVALLGLVVVLWRLFR